LTQSAGQLAHCTTSAETKSRIAQLPPDGPVDDHAGFAITSGPEANDRKEIVMTKLRHVALHTPDPEKTAEFYKSVFGLTEVGRTDSPLATGIYLSDGTINLAVLRFKTAEAADRRDGLGPVFGLHHFGFWVENPDETRRKLKEAGAEYRESRAETATSSFFEEKYKGPDGVMLDITGQGWVGAEPLSGTSANLRHK
jgi:catechol 2,3-dioxygenase-like lactoylglutathione lyase family enzyme